MRKNDIEKSLKRFLKRKVSYSLSLLIAFMITGGISLGAGITAEEIQETKNDLLTRIQTEREEIKRKIEENERLIKEYNLDFVELVRKGDFYSKPLMPSTQVFFSYQHLDNGTMKNKTISEFSKTIDAINKHYGTKSGRSLLESNGNIGVDKILEGNGVAVDDNVFRETIEVGANIKLIQPELPVVNPNVSVTVSAPTVNLGALPETVSPTTPTITPITAPSINAPSAPAGVSVTVTTPSTVEKITVTAPTITTPTAPSDKTITVATPITPDGYTPSIIPVPNKPGTPATPAISVLVPLNLTFNGTGFGQGYTPSMSKNNIIAQNYDSYSTTGTLNIETGTTTSGTSWSGGTMQAVTGATTVTLTSPGSTSSQLNAFISDAANHDVIINGNYVMTRGTLGNSTAMFVSLNPYEVGRGGTTANRTYTFAGTLTLNGHNNASSGSCLVGFEHQLLRGGGGGGSFSTTSTSILENTGTIILNSGYNMVGIMIDTEYNESSIAGSAFTTQPQTKNSGNIIINGKQSIGIDYGYYYSARPNSIVSLGNIEINGENNYGFRMKDYFNNNNFYYDATNVTGSNGTITVAGKKNIGVAIAQGTSTGDPISRITGLNILVNGEENVGFFRNVTTATNTNDMVLNDTTVNSLNFGANAKKSTLVRSDQNAIQLNKNITVTSGLTGNSFAQASGTGTIKNTAILQSNLSEFTGLIANGSGASITNSGTIEITGNNNKNIGLATVNNGVGSNSGTVKVLGTGNNKSGIYNTGTFTISNGSNIEVTGESSSGIYNSNTVNINGTVVLKGTEGTTAIYSNGGTITSTSGNTLTISIDDTSNPTTRGLAVYAEGGATVNLGAAKIDVKNGAAGIAAFGAGTSINLTGAELKYSGEGYAAYSDGNGTINLTNANLELSGKATGVELDLLAPKVTMNNTTITMMSNDATVANLKNATGLLTSNLKSTVETNLGSGVTIVDGSDGTNTFDKYKIATVDGGDLTIDANMDKYNRNSNNAGYFYSRRFMGQRLNLSVGAGITVTASTDTAYATTYFNNQVVGLEMNSSKAATSATDAQINLLANSKVIADRTDSGNGAIGLYMNFGKIDIAAGAEVEVEKGTGGGNIVNNKAVGIYAVNGSTVSNAGDIKVGGNQSIGILGMAYREQPVGTPIVDEFGTGGIFTIQGKVNVTNSKNITLDGTGTIGIYVHNNKVSGLNTDAVVTNTVNGVITVGSSDSLSAAVGIYGKNATISNLGKISVGDGGVAIYATEGSRITDLGTLDLGADGVGVMVDGASTISANSVTLTSNNTGTLGKTGIFYKGTLGTEDQNVGVNINASALDKGTAIYAENMNVTSSGTLNIGKEGVGIFVKGNSSQTGKNTGSIDLTSGKIGAVGMYTKTANLINESISATTGIISVNDASQIGMYAEGINVKAINKGTINLNVDGATGIYVKSGATAKLGTGNNIVFGGKSSVGVFAENAKVNFENNLTFTNDNVNKNIYVYGKNSSVGIDAGSLVKVDGINIPTTAGIEGNKTVGIYLENAGTGSTFNGTGNLEVLNGAVGIYSKGNNTLDVNVAVAGDKTTGIFIDGASTISGTVTAKGTSSAGAVGVYGSGGIVTVGAGGLVLNTDAGRGTGMYLTDGASTTGGSITVNNTAAGTKNIGVYYSKGATSGTVTNSSAISLIGSESIGIYAADGITLVNNANITSTAGKTEDIGSYVGGGSQLTSTGTITMNDNDSIGIYTEEGKGINSGNILMNGSPSAPTKSVVGMVAEAKAGKTAAVENAAGGTITAGANLGMYIGGTGTSSGKNAGTITTTTGTGVYVDGSTNSFDGTGGTINSNAVGMYLKNTGVNKITAGTFNIASGGVGVFGENANIDFAVNVSGVEAVGVAAKTNSIISGNITTTGQDSIGVYVLDNNVSFNGANITTGTKSGAPLKTSIGVLLKDGLGTYTMNNVTVNAQNGVGIYLDGTTSGTNLTHSGTINTAGGIGIYVDNGTTLTTNTTVLNINGGTGVYIEGGTANLGTGGNLTFNFLAGGGIGAFNKGGTLNLGSNITVAGSGSLAATANGSLNSTGNLNIGEGATGMLGTYDGAMTGPQSITNTGGTITAISGGIGLAAVKDTTNPTHSVTINNTGTITASGKSSTNKPSIGIYTDVADVANTGNINVGNNGIGIYSAHNGVLTSVQNNNITMTGTDGIGVYIKGATNGLTANNITSTGSKNTGVVLEETTGNINVGTVVLGNESVGTFVTGAGALTIDGTITVGNGSTSKSAIGVVAQNGANMTLAGTATITAGTKGIGVYAQGAGTNITVSNTANITVGTDGIYMYSKDATLNFSGNITANDQIGIVADGGTINAIGASTITVQNGGIGAYVKGAAPTFGTTAIAVQAGTSSKYSMGVYYDGVAALGTAPVITQTGSYTIGMVLNNSTGTTAGGISIGSTTDNNQVGVMAKGNSNLTIAGNISVDGDKNIGVYGENSQITVNSNLSVGDSSASENKSTSSIGVSLNGGSYIGAGNISVGDHSIGIFGKGMTAGSIITQGTGVQTMTVGNDGLGIYGEGTGGTITAAMSSITVGTDNAIGVYAKGMDSIVTGNMNVGANTSIGIVNEGNGNVTYTGAMTIANKASTASVGIYKADGAGTISTSAGNWAIGTSGYGIFLNQTTGQSAAINNNAHMNLGMSAVGIYSNGSNIITNTGNITVGSTNVNGNHNDTTKHENSVGMYLSGGTIATSSGTITVNHDHSVGVYGAGAGTKFTNTGTINIDNGGVGVLVRDGAIAVNAAGANINLGGTLAACGATTVGMAAYSGARIENAGTITVNEGVGMLIGMGATFTNTGTIYVNNGVGIEGPGALTNTGTIIVTGTGTATGSTGLATAQVGAVEIKPDGTIKINGNYTSIGGTLTTAGAIIVDGAYVDVTTGTPLFNAHSVSGEVRLLPNFATTGNGISYEIEGFVNTAMGTITGTKLTPVTSPLFIAKVTDKGNLVIAKRPYADLTIGDQFDALDKGLDNILKNSGGIGKDAEILKGLNQYLEGLPADQFERETSRKLAETRGDIYSTIQGRMQDINRAFDNSFYELESSYNLTKDSSKYSVIYTDGNYKDPTLGIDDYDYKVMGLLYMKEKEGTEYRSKYGYTIGFAGSKFDFDDGGSKEDVYSLRAGIHRVKNLSDEHKVSWLSRIELGYNRHIAKRKLNLQETFENKGEYNTYSVALDNRLTKVIYTDLSKQLDVYADLDLEYGKVDGFKESAGSKGGLEVQIDLYSVKYSI